jgi:3-demethoxyubiquinol 3-hydroxylase
MPNREYSPMDRLLLGVDDAVRTLFGRPRLTERPNPAIGLGEADLSEAERDHIARLMRINHTGEVCAQALYQGQALTAKLPEVRQSMERAALEENDHLEWCDRRIQDLGGRKSLLNPFWYAGSFAIGALAGLAGDKWSLGFVAETEHQVDAHLREHLKEVPVKDQRTRAILAQMREDELHHASLSLEGGGAKLPLPIRLAMKVTAKAMTTTVYRI